MARACRASYAGGSPGVGCRVGSNRTFANHRSFANNTLADLGRGSLSFRWIHSHHVAGLDRSGRGTPHSLVGGDFYIELGQWQQAEGSGSISNNVATASRSRKSVGAYGIGGFGGRQSGFGGIESVDWDDPADLESKSTGECDA